MLEEVDRELAQRVQEQGCQFCLKGTLHRADYERKPRGGPAHWEERHSFCCDREGCRRRHTPPSVRFLGRKVYVAFVVVLKTSLHQGLNAITASSVGVRIGSFPIPVVFFHLEDGQWVDFPVPGFQAWSAVLTNIVTITALATVPLWLLSWRQHRHGQTQAQPAASANAG